MTTPTPPTIGDIVWVMSHVKLAPERVRVVFVRADGSEFCGAGAEKGHLNIFSTKQILTEAQFAVHRIDALRREIANIIYTATPEQIEAAWAALQPNVNQNGD